MIPERNSKRSFPNYSDLGGSLFSILRGCGGLVCRVVPLAKATGSPSPMMLSPPQTEDPKRKFPTGRSQPKAPSERSQVGVLKRKGPSESPQPRDPKRQFLNEISHVKESKRKIASDSFASEQSQAKVIELGLPSEIPKRNIQSDSSANI